MAQWVKTLDVRPDNLSSISGFHTGKGGNQALTFVLWPLHVYCGVKDAYSTNKIHTYYHNNPIEQAVSFPPLF